MGISVAVTRVACNIGTGNQDITTSDLGGLTPKAAFFVVTCAIADGVAADHAVLGIGAATATDERWSVGISAEHNKATSDVYRRATTDECVLKLNAVDGAVDGEADFVEFIENGVRINWGDAPAAAYLLTVTFFAGTDLSAHVGTVRIPDAQDDATDVTTVGFEPDLLLLASHGGNFGDASGSNAHPSHGVALNKSPVQQYCWTVKHDDGEGTSVVGAQITDDYGSTQVGSDGVATLAGEFGAFDANGFSCTARLAGGGGNYIGYLALAFGGVVDFWAGIIDAPVSTGNQSQTGPGFTPQYVHVGVTQMPAINTAYADANAGSYGISTFDGDDEHCGSVQDEDNQATTDTQSLSDDTVVNLPDDDGTQAHVASFVSFDANGWTWNFSATEDPAVKYWALVIGQGDGVDIAVLRRRREGY